MTDIEEDIENVIDREGGDKFTDIPEDRGGPTRFGITLPALTEWLGRPATVQDLKSMTRKDAHELYRELYIQRPGFGIIGSQPLLSLVLDTAVNFGVKGAVKLLQRAVGVKDDGVFGPVTKQAVVQADYAGIYRNLCAERIRFRGRIITSDPSQAKFAAGWANRDADFIERG